MSPLHVKWGLYNMTHANRDFHLGFPGSEQYTTNHDRKGGSSLAFGRHCSGEPPKQPPLPFPRTSRLGIPALRADLSDNSQSLAYFRTNWRAAVTSATPLTPAAQSAAPGFRRAVASDGSPPKAANNTGDRGAVMASCLADPPAIRRPTPQDCNRVRQARPCSACPRVTSTFLRSSARQEGQCGDESRSGNTPISI
jgi:hypothetical protein